MKFTENTFMRSVLQASETDILTETSPGPCCGAPNVNDSLMRINQLCPEHNIQGCIDQAKIRITLKSLKGHCANLTLALFTGAAGLAFALMRALKPNQVSSMLWFG